MILCVPSSSENGMESEVGLHFGRVPYYTIVEDEKVRIIKNTSRHMDGIKYPPELLKNEGVDVMICREIGGRAVKMFREIGIDVYVGASGKVSDAVESFRKNQLAMVGKNHVCRGHGD